MRSVCATSGALWDDTEAQPSPGGASRRTRSDTRSRRTYWREEPTSGPSKSSWGTRASRRRSATPTSPALACSRPTSRATRGPDGAHDEDDPDGRQGAREAGEDDEVLGVEDRGTLEVAHEGGDRQRRG